MWNLSRCSNNVFIASPFNSMLWSASNQRRQWELSMTSILRTKSMFINCPVATETNRGDIYFFPQRTFAAFAAICERFRGLSIAALAAPPLSPPKRPSATAAGFFFFTSGGPVFSAWPVASWMIRYASWLGSRGRVLERLDMTPSVWQAKGQSQQ